MKHDPILRGVMQDGKIRWHGTDAKRLAVITKHLEGKEIELTLRAKSKRRSLNQNAYYWGVVVAAIAEAMGCERPEEAHDALRLHFLMNNSGPLPTVKSTTELTTVEFEEYMRQCRQLGAQMFGLYIEEPNEVEMKA